MAFVCTRNMMRLKGICKNEKKWGKKEEKTGKRKNKKKTTVANLMNKTGLHCHAAFVSVLGKLLISTELRYSLDKGDCNLLIQLGEGEQNRCWWSWELGFGNLSVLPCLPLLPSSCCLAVILLSLKQKRWPETWDFKLRPIWIWTWEFGFEIPSKSNLQWTFRFIDRIQYHRGLLSTFGSSWQKSHEWNSWKPLKMAAKWSSQASPQSSGSTWLFGSVVLLKNMLFWLDWKSNPSFPWTKKKPKKKSKTKKKSQSKSILSQTKHWEIFFNWSHV